MCMSGRLHPYIFMSLRALTSLTPLYIFRRCASTSSTWTITAGPPFAKRSRAMVGGATSAISARALSTACRTAQSSARYAFSLSLVHIDKLGAQERVGDRRSSQPTHADPFQGRLHVPQRVPSGEGDRGLQDMHLCQMRTGPRVLAVRRNDAEGRPRSPR